MPETNRLEAGRRGRPDLIPACHIALIRERRRRLAALPRYDRYIAEAEGDLTLQAFWRNFRRQDLEDAQRLGARLGGESASPAAGGVGSTPARRRPGPEEVRHAGPL